MPRVMTKDDVMRTAVNLGRADRVWSAFCDSSSCPPGMQLPDGGAYQLIFLRVPDAAPQTSKKPRVKIGLMDGKWKLPAWEEDKALDREIEADFELTERNDKIATHEWCAYNFNNAASGYRLECR